MQRTTTLGLLCVLLTVGLAGCATPGSPGAPSNVPAPGQAWDLSGYGADNDPTLGDLRQPVQVISYLAPSCGACSNFHFNQFEGASGIRATYLDSDRIGWTFLQGTNDYNNARYDLAGGRALECVNEAHGVDHYKELSGDLYGSISRARGDEVTVARDVLENYLDEHDLGDTALECFDANRFESEVRSDYEAFRREASKVSGRSPSQIYAPNFLIVTPDQVTFHEGRDIRGAIEDALQRTQG